MYHLEIIFALHEWQLHLQPPGLHTAEAYLPLEEHCVWWWRGGLPHDPSNGFTHHYWLHTRKFFSSEIRWLGVSETIPSGSTNTVHNEVLGVVEGSSESWWAGWLGRCFLTSSLYTVVVCWFRDIVLLLAKWWGTRSLLLVNTFLLFCWWQRCMYSAYFN